MIVREVTPESKNEFNRVAVHPLQAWEWGEFREKTGKRVIRLGVYDTHPGSDLKNSPARAGLKAGYQLTVHPIPQTPYKILYFPRGPMPDKTMINALKKMGKQEKAVFVKMEPNVGDDIKDKPKQEAPKNIHNFLINNDCRSGQSFFHEYTFRIDLTKSDEKLLAAMHQKTRYNIRVAQRYEVEITEDNSNRAFQNYLRLTERTTKRQRFYAHTPEYHQKMWETLQPAGIAHLFNARYQGRVLATWILFTFNNILYYPYGASTRDHQEVMPGYALMWQAIQYGKQLGCHTLDLWGCLGPNPNKTHPWYGFHRFKEGFGGELIKFIGTYDLVVNIPLYSVYNLANKARWKFLDLKAKVV